MNALRSFRSILNPDQLSEVLAAPPDELDQDRPKSLPASQPLDDALAGPIDGDGVRAALEDAAQIASGVDRSDPKQRAPVDARVVELIHGPLEALTHQAASDPGFWTWLACGPGRAFTWMRWSDLDPVPADSAAVDAALNAKGSQVAKRFRMVSSGLHGVSRHALARLWWLGDSLDGDYDAAAKMLANQDVFQAVYERKIGLAPGLSRTLIEVFSLGENSIGGATFRSEIMKPIRQLASVTRIEALEADDLRALVESVRDERLGDV